MTWMRGARRHCTADICDTAMEVLSCRKTGEERAVNARDVFAEPSGRSQTGLNINQDRRGFAKHHPLCGAGNNPTLCKRNT